MVFTIALKIALPVLSERVSLRRDLGQHVD